MILVPKLKYERLRKQVDPVKEPLTQDTTTIEQTLKQSPEKQQQTVNDFEFADTTNLLQSGTGFVSKKKKGRETSRNIRYSTKGKNRSLA